MVRIDPPLHLILTTVICGLFVMAFAHEIAAANSYNVQANVPSSSAKLAARFDDGLDGTTVSDGSFTLAGSCQPLNPEAVIAIWRDNTIIGSTICTNGSFSIAIILNDGANQFVARTGDAAGSYGPDSQPITVTLQLPANVVPPASTASGSEPSSPIDEETAINAGVAADLHATTTAPFSVIATGKDVTIDVNVSGGNSPYVIMLNWGDGTTESHDVKQAGVYSYSHTYQKQSNYQVKGAVRDVLGAYTEFSYAVVNFTKRPVAKATGSTQVNSHPNNVALYTTSAVAIGGGLVLAYSGYRLGMRDAGRFGKSNRRKSTAKQTKAKRR